MFGSETHPRRIFSDAVPQIFNELDALRERESLKILNCTAHENNSIQIASLIKRIRRNVGIRPLRIIRRVWGMVPEAVRFARYRRVRRALSTTLDNQPAYRPPVSLSFRNGRGRRVGRILFRKFRS